MKQLHRNSSFALIVSFVCVALVGLALTFQLPVKLAPSYVLPKLTIYYSMPNTSPRVVESQVTRKIEGMLTRVKGVKHIKSLSDNGAGRVTLELDKHADIDMVRFEVSTLIRQLWPQLPREVSYPQIKYKHSTNEASHPFSVYTINAPASLQTIQQYAEETIKPELAQIDGVNRIDVYGATPMEWQLLYDSKQLKQMGVSIADLRSAISHHYGKLFLGACRVYSQADGQFNPAEINLMTQSGKVISLDKLLRVKHVAATPYGYYRINGLNSIYISVFADDRVNQLTLSKKVNACVVRLKKIIPVGYETHVVYEESTHIQKELRKIFFRTGLTVLILLLFVILITRNLQYIILIVTSLTINIAMAVIFYYVFGLEMQLYSMAGITISLNLIIDTIIVMADHILYQKNTQVFIPILTSTLTTIGALTIIFFLNEKLRLNLQDFAAVVIINLIVSLLVALLLVPAMVNKLGLDNRYRSDNIWRKRRVIRFAHIYQGLIRFVSQHRVGAYALLVLVFGLPVFMLPNKMDGDDIGGMLYNKVFGRTLYQKHLRPITDRLFGGTLRLFVQNVYNDSYMQKGVQEVSLNIQASLPNGSTLEQMNDLVQQVESYLTTCKGIKQFQTSVNDPYSAYIRVLITDDLVHTTFPFTLKEQVIDKVLNLGGGSWYVALQGLRDDQNFNNSIRENAGFFRVKMYGYNYDELIHWAEKLKSMLLKHQRVREVFINSQFRIWKDGYSEYYLDLNRARMVEEGITAKQLFDVLRPIFGRDVYAGHVVEGNQIEALKLSSRQADEYDVWGLLNTPLMIHAHTFKLGDFATLKKDYAVHKIQRVNQQYQVCLQYDYIGLGNQGRAYLVQDLRKLKKQLPMGYSAEYVNQSGWSSWNNKDNKQYFLLLLVIGIVFFTTSILFNSLKQPFAIIFVIPISYIGVFLIFFLFGLNFDHGGFASLVLLCGITVNASIYIMDAYNSIRGQRPQICPIDAYVKAWNLKIIPVFLTILSTILGFIPFMISGQNEPFWFSLAAGTIGGLIASLIGLFFFLPIFVLRKKDVAIIHLLQNTGTL